MANRLMYYTKEQGIKNFAMISYNNSMRINRFVFDTSGNTLLKQYWPTFCGLQSTFKL